MSLKGFKSHPYIPNSVEEVQNEMLREIGLNDLEDLHAEIPEELKLKENMNLPKAIGSEYELKRHVQDILKKNKTCDSNINFLGGGCWQHYVPALCDEINSRGEFLTAYGGESYNDFGRFQTLFEYQSLVAELVDMDVVNVPTMDGPQAVATALRMAGRITGRNEILVPALMDKDKFMIVDNYCKSALKLIEVDYNKENGQLNLEDLKSKINDKTAAVFFENPSFFGFIEENGQQISDIAHEAGALSVVFVDPSSLGVLKPPSQYGADIIAGELQPLGMHMNYGGGQAGFMATRDEEEFVMEFPSRLFGVTSTIVEGEYGFGDVAYDRTSFGHHRHEGKEYVGTQTALWGITAGVYLATMGPKGMFELGQTIMQNVQYAIKKLDEIENIKASLFNSTSFKEFVVDFNQTGKTVEEINKMLIKKGIFGGKDLSKDFPQFGQTALYCVTEIHTKDDIDKLVNTLKECL
jgi:glycine dehydrogenase subunit 1